MADMIVVNSKVKERVSKAGFNTAGSFSEALSGHVDIVITRAVERAKANGRKTVRPEDI